MSAVPSTTSPTTCRRRGQRPRGGRAGRPGCRRPGGGGDARGARVSPPVAVDQLRGRREDREKAGDEPVAWTSRSAEPSPAVRRPATLESAPTEKVDALFAKLRAANGSADTRESEEESASDGHRAAGGTPAEAESSAGTRRGRRRPATDPEASEEAPVSEEGHPADRPPRVVERDELVAPVVATLSRRLKRTLQDTQNDILDQLRSNGSQWSARGPARGDRAGRRAHHGRAPGPRRGGRGRCRLRRRRRHGVSVGGRDDRHRPRAGRRGRGAAPAQAVGRRRSGGGRRGSGRRARGRRLPRMAGLAGRAAGRRLRRRRVLAGIGDRRRDATPTAGSSGSRSPAPGDAPCPDCEDNGLTGPQPPGEEFPTGHRHPPAHPGCRCLVAPTAPRLHPCVPRATCRSRRGPCAVGTLDGVDGSSPPLSS